MMCLKRKIERERERRRRRERGRGVKGERGGRWVREKQREEEREEMN